MYTLLRNPTVRRGLLTDAPAMLASMGVAQMFYHFGSFILELGAFLVTWLAVSCLLNLASTAWAARQTTR